MSSFLALKASPPGAEPARAATPRWCAALAAAVPGLIHAAALVVNVNDAAGKPLIDAIAMLEPVGAAAPVKPMPDVEISQQNRQFHPSVTLITTGTRVTFPNFDTVRHHVYSFSPIKPFELKLYAGVPNAPILFDKPGIAVLGCNIHDTMVAWVVVADTPWFARSAATGRARIEGVPAGNYKLRVWHPGALTGPEPTLPMVTVGASDSEQTVQLAVGSQP